MIICANHIHGIQLLNKVKSLIPLNTDEKLIIGDIKKWDLSITVEVALKYPFGSKEPMNQTYQIREVAGTHKLNLRVTVWYLN